MPASDEARTLASTEHGDRIAFVGNARGVRRKILDSGVLTEAEFVDQKARLLS